MLKVNYTTLPKVENTPKHHPREHSVLEHPRPHFLPISRAPATNLAGKYTHHSIPKPCALRYIIKERHIKTAIK